MGKPTDETVRDSPAPAALAGASEGSSNQHATPIDLVRRLETDRLLQSERIRTLGIVLMFGSIGVVLAALATVMLMMPYLDETKFVMFEVEKSTGIVRRVHELNAPYAPDEGVREYFITQQVRYLETFDRPTVDWMANILRHYVSQEVLSRYIERMKVLDRSMGSTEKRLVSVGSILPITEHENAQSYNQSTIDFEITLERQDGTSSVVPMVAIMTYRFVPYTAAELESDDEDMRDKIRKNPLGMEISDYRVDAKLPSQQANN